ncbi:hypothetical protein M2139_001732 [Enterococcus sp. PF1-24]|uniref:hypothetical protein n=1 Tax=unclassified Enterococcus TaxID=2608891 RepID=UPI0024762F14|nr:MULTISPECIES: hypothetical protein [unclassified Enterococcus]MDH6364692.1 hypothetical protein [Enterococcus sp. PFB1-1]MDH6401832.1 hypothetical protein [Enterococcus sp. PF1-24]
MRKNRRFAKEDFLAMIAISTLLVIIITFMEHTNPESFMTKLLRNSAEFIFVPVFIANAIIYLEKYYKLTNQFEDDTNENNAPR